MSKSPGKGFLSSMYIVAKHFRGFPKQTDITLVQKELPALKDGEFLAKAEYLSVDPYMRAYAPNYKIGQVMLGEQIAKVIESKSETYPVGTHVLCRTGWKTHFISNADLMKTSTLSKGIVPVMGNLPISLALGMLGLTGNTAYFGLLEICKPKFGETVVVSGAGGAVGSHVGQIAKIKGCKAIGIVGSDEKGNWLINELGFDHFINYKKSDIKAKLKECAPNGVDCYFDNVGGEISSTVMSLMNKNGRIAVSGSISDYNSDLNSLQKCTVVQGFVVFKQLSMQGFVVTEWATRWNEGIEQNMKWIQEGKLKYRETITEGFENIFSAFTDMLQGKNIGKAIVKV